MLGNIHQPTLVVHGNKDVVVMPINAFLLAQHLPNAQLTMYPRATGRSRSMRKSFSSTRGCSWTDKPLRYPASDVPTVTTSDASKF